MPRCHIGIGSNVEPEAHVRRVLRELRERFGQLQVSPAYGSPAVGFEGDDFLNLVIGLDTDLSPEQLLQELRALEDAHGRDRTAPKFGPRPLDLDLLTYGDLTGQVAGKQLPHPDIQKYPFVLRPMAELAPDALVPGTTETFSGLRERLRLDESGLHKIHLARDNS